jgi:quinone-modifying oxidoreductase subunit QmoC
MAATLRIEPDAAFVKDVIANGGGDLKKCFQCATCSAVCTLSPEASPFPRRQMIEAQWGLKEQLVGDPALWLCHNCGECSDRCPRGARPGDVMGSLRRAAIRHFAFPSFMGGAVANARALPLLLLLPVLIFAAVALYAPRGEATGQLEFANVFPIGVIEPLFFVVAGLALLGFAVGLSRFVAALRAGGADGAILAGLIPALSLIIAHSRFKNCKGKAGDRYLGHFLTFLGFMGLAVMGTIVGLGTMAGVMETPLPAANPLKIFANICALAILIGGVMLLVHRSKLAASSTYFDWFFLLTLVLTAATGIASELLRLAQAAALMYAVYFTHLVLIFTLFLYAPYSKFAHLVYRTVAIAAAEGRSTR